MERVYQPVEILGSTDSNKTIRICQLSKDSNVIIALKLTTHSHSEQT